MDINGKQLAQQVKDNIKAEIESLGIKPKFLIIQSGDYDASNVYVRNKIKACEYCGIEVTHKDVSENTTEDIMDYIILNQKDYDAVMVQLPLKDNQDYKQIINCIDPDKDVDGLTTTNVGRLWNNEEGLFPCTALGCIELIKTVYQDLGGRCACIVGRSNLVGKPLIALLQRENCTVISCNSHTRNVGFYTGGNVSPDIVISAIGQPKKITPGDLCDFQIIIDVGINRDENGKLCGDVDYEDAIKYLEDIHITPVPGGVGPMTVAMLMSNILKSYKLQHSIL